MGVLVRLAGGGQRLGTFMDDQYKDDPLIVRAGERSGEQVSHNAGVRRVRLHAARASGKTDRHMEPFYIQIAGDAQAHFPSSHEGEEFIIVMEGEIELVYGEETHLLKSGDSAYYNSSRATPGLCREWPAGHDLRGDFMPFYAGGRSPNHWHRTKVFLW